MSTITQHEKESDDSSPQTDDRTPADSEDDIAYSADYLIGFWQILTSDSPLQCSQTALRVLGDEHAIDYDVLTQHSRLLAFARSSGLSYDVSAAEETEHSRLAVFLRSLFDILSSLRLADQEDLPRRNRDLVEAERSIASIAAASDLSADDLCYAVDLVNAFHNASSDDTAHSPALSALDARDDEEARSHRTIGYARDDGDAGNVDSVDSSDTVVGDNVQEPEANTVPLDIVDESDPSRDIPLGTVIFTGHAFGTTSENIVSAYESDLFWREVEEVISRIDLSADERAERILESAVMLNISEDETNESIKYLARAVRQGDGSSRRVRTENIFLGEEIFENTHGDAPASSPSSDDAVRPDDREDAEEAAESRSAGGTQRIGTSALGDDIVPGTREFVASDDAIKSTLFAVGTLAFTAGITMTAVAFRRLIRARRGGTFS